MRFPAFAALFALAGSAFAEPSRAAVIDAPDGCADTEIVDRKRRALPSGAILRDISGLATSDEEARRIARVVNF